MSVFVAHIMPIGLITRLHHARLLMRARVRISDPFVPVISGCFCESERQESTQRDRARVCVTGRRVNVCCARTSVGGKHNSVSSDAPVVPTEKVHHEDVFGDRS